MVADGHGLIVRCRGCGSALNPPQGAALGLHSVVERPVGREGRVELRPMTFVSLAYDRRLATGGEAAAFVGRVKECLEDPSRIMLEA